MDGIACLARISPEKRMCPKFAAMPINVALREVEGLIDRGFPAESEQWCDLRGILRDLKLTHGYDAAVVILKLDATSLFFLSFALAIYGLKINVQ